MTLSLTPVTPAIGALVEGLRIGAAVDSGQVQQIQSALLKHHVLFFRDQRFTPIEHRDFAAQFGRLHIHPIYPNHAEAGEIIVMDTDKTDLKDNSIWHTDVTFSPTPPMGGILAAQNHSRPGRRHAVEQYSRRVRCIDAGAARLSAGPHGNA